MLDTLGSMSVKRYPAALDRPDRLLLTNVDFTKEGLPIIASAAVGLAVFYAYRIFRKAQART